MLLSPDVLSGAAAGTGSAVPSHACPTQSGQTLPTPVPTVQRAPTNPVSMARRGHKIDLQFVAGV